MKFYVMDVIFSERLCEQNVSGARGRVFPALLATTSSLCLFYLSSRALLS